MRVIMILILTITLSGCAALGHVLPFLGSKASNGISVNTRVGHTKSNIGVQSNEVKTNQGTVVAARHNIRQAQTINIHELATEHLLIFAIVLFCAGFLIGWPMAATPQRMVSRLFKRLFNRKDSKEDER